MPIAAVPGYLRDRFESASPGLRFGMYLPVWTSIEDQRRELDARAKKKSSEAAELKETISEHGMDAAIALLVDKEKLPALWTRNTEGARNSRDIIEKMSGNDTDTMEALLERQDVLFECISDSETALVLDAVGVAPFTTGLGNEHPLENGFAFLNPYGLPYLPGSGVKGVLRQAARELSSGHWGDKLDWNDDFIDILFGREAEDGENHRRGALTFWDVIPQVKGNRLLVEVMTAHQTDYYQKGDTPHESGKPNPINFLTVPPGSAFRFHVECDLPFLRRLDEDLAVNGRWQALIRAAFEHAFEWLGFGAKTSVGYGAMVENVAASNRRQVELADRKKRLEAERALQTRVAGLPEDAAWLETQASDPGWSDNSRFLDLVESFLTDREKLSSEALERLKGEVENRWAGITKDPDAVVGKKRKPKYKDRPRNLARRLESYSVDSE